MCRESESIAKRRVETARLRAASEEHLDPLHDPSTVKALPAQPDDFRDLIEQVKRIH